MMSAKEALAAARVIVPADIHVSATEYRQHGGMMTLQFCLQLPTLGGCEMVELTAHSGEAEPTWPQALDRLRDEHVRLVEKMRAREPARVEAKEVQP